MSTFRISATVASLLLTAAPAYAASDYLLQLGGAKGAAGGDAAPQSIEVESFSWGASNPGSVAAKGGTGKVSVQDLSVMSAKAPRDAATGQASGKRAATAAVADSSAEASVRPQPAASPQVGDEATFVVMVRESPTKASTGRSSDCVKGEHIPKAVIVGRGQRVEMSDVVVTSCSVVNGMARKEFKGHVTLLK